MAVEPSMLIAPLGLVESSLFPGEDLAGRLTQYISEKPTDSDDAVKAWAYHRAFMAVYLRLSSTPSTASFSEGGSESYTTAQIKSFYDLSQQYLKEYKHIVSPAPLATQRGGTASVRQDFTW